MNLRPFYNTFEEIPEAYRIWFNREFDKYRNAEGWVLDGNYKPYEEMKRKKYWAIAELPDHKTEVIRGADTYEDLQLELWKTPVQPYIWDVYCDNQYYRLCYSSLMGVAEMKWVFEA